MIRTPAFILYEDDPLTIATMEAYFAMMGQQSTDHDDRGKLYEKILELRQKRDSKIALQPEIITCSDAEFKEIQRSLKS